MQLSTGLIADLRESISVSDENPSGGNAAPQIPDWLTRPPAWWSAPPTAPQHAAPPVASASAPNDLLTELRGMPEKVVNAIREATQPQQSPPPAVPPPPTAAPAPAQSTEGQQAGDAKPGGQKLSFGERWFA
jgi:hypothetical protein